MRTIKVLTVITWFAAIFQWTQVCRAAADVYKYNSSNGSFSLTTSNTFSTTAATNPWVWSNTIPSSAAEVQAISNVLSVGNVGGSHSYSMGLSGKSAARAESLWLLDNTSARFLVTFDNQDSVHIGSSKNGEAPLLVDGPTGQVKVHGSEVMTSQTGWLMFGVCTTLLLLVNMLFFQLRGYLRQRTLRNFMRKQIAEQARRQEREAVSPYRDPEATYSFTFSVAPGFMQTFNELWQEYLLERSREDKNKS